jgi:glycerol-3-phosphate dehydrogenase
METWKYSIIFSISGRTVAGTTDTPTKLTFSPKPTKSEVQFILDEIKDYLSEDIRGKMYGLFDLYKLKHSIS